MAEIWLFKVLGVARGAKIWNPRKTQNMGPRAKIFGILEYLPKGYLYTKKEQIQFFLGFSVWVICHETAQLRNAEVELSLEHRVIQNLHWRKQFFFSGGQKNRGDWGSSHDGWAIRSILYWRVLASFCKNNVVSTFITEGTHTSPNHSHSDLKRRI